MAKTGAKGPATAAARDAGARGASVPATPSAGRGPGAAAGAGGAPRAQLPRPLVRFAGFSLLACWFISVCLGPFMRGWVVALGPHALDPVCLGAALMALTVLLVTLRVVPLSRRYAAGVLMGLLASLGILATSMPGMVVPLLGPWVLWVLAVVAGACVMGLSLAWQEYFATQGVRAALLGMAACCAVGTVLFAGLCALPAGDEVRCVVVALMPLASALVLRPQRGTRFYATFSGGITTRQLLANILNDYSPRMFVLCGLATMAAACGCAPCLRALTSLDSGAPARELVGEGALVAVGVLVGLAMALACAAVAFGRPQRIMRLFYGALPLLMAGVALAFVAGEAAGSGGGAAGVGLAAGIAGAAGLVSTGAGLSGAFCLVWALMVDCAHRKRLPTLGLLASLGAACFAGLAFGLAGAALAGYDTARCAVAALVVLGIAALVFASFNGKVNVSEESFAAPARTSQEEATLAYAARHGLTPRETEVLQVWLTGHNAAYIERELGISRNTVKTHLNHIYQKTGTSGREDLLAALDEAQLR